MLARFPMQAAEDLIAYVNKHQAQDPFSPSANQPNPWINTKSGGMSCVIL